MASMSECRPTHPAIHDHWAVALDELKLREAAFWT
jgi:hypothetical protein